MHITHAYVHWLADVHFGSFAPAFTLSFHDSECSRKPPMDIASVVMRQCKKKYEKQHFIDNLHFRYILISFYQQRKEKKKYTRFACIVYLIHFRKYKYENCNSWLGFTNMGLS